MYKQGAGRGHVDPLDPMSQIQAISKAALSGETVRGFNFVLGRLSFRVASPVLVARPLDRCSRSVSTQIVACPVKL